MAKASKREVKKSTKPARKKSSQKTEVIAPELKRREVYLTLKEPDITWLEAKARARGLIKHDKRTGAEITELQPVIYDILFQVRQAEIS